MTSCAEFAEKLNQTFAEKSSFFLQQGFLMYCSDDYQLPLVFLIVD